MADTALVFSIFARGGKAAAEQFQGIARAAVDVEDKTGKLGRVGQVMGSSLITTAKRSSVAIAGIGAASAGASIAASSALAQVSLAVVGVGVRAALQADKVKNAFKSAGTSIQKTFTNATSALHPVLINFANTIKSRIGALGPQLKAMYSQMAPALGGVLAKAADQIKPLGAFFVKLGHAAVPILNQIATALGPLIHGAIGFFQPLLASAGKLAPVFGQILAAVAQLMPVLGQLLAALAKAGAPIIGPLLKLIGTLVSTLVSALAPALPPITRVIARLGPIFGRIVTALGPLIGAIGDLLAAFAPLLPPIARVISSLVGGLVPALTPLIGIVGQIVQVVGGFLVSALQMLLPVILPILPVISQLGQKIGTALLTVLKELAPALLQVLHSLLPLLPALVPLIPVFGRLITALTPLLVIVIRLAAVILSAVLPVVVKLATVLVAILGGALKVVVGIVSKGIGAIVAVFRWLYDVLVGHSIPDLVNGITRWFAALPGRVIGFFQRMASGAISRAAGLLAWMRGLPGRILRAVGGLGHLLVGAGRNIVRGLWSGISSLGGWLYAKIINFVKSFVPGPVLKYLGIASPSRLFTWIGKQLPAGMVAGMATGHRAVTAAAVKLGELSVPPLTGTKVGGLAGHAVGGLAGLGHQVGGLAGLGHKVGGLAGLGHQVGGLAGLGHQVGGLAGAFAPIGSGPQVGGDRIPAVRVIFDFRGDADLRKWFKKVVRIDGGGDVQVAFGGI